MTDVNPFNESEPQHDSSGSFDLGPPWTRHEEDRFDERMAAFPKVRKIAATVIELAKTVYFSITEDEATGLNTTRRAGKYFDGDTDITELRRSGFLPEDMMEDDALGTTPPLVNGTYKPQRPDWFDQLTMGVGTEAGAFGIATPKSRLPFDPSGPSSGKGDHGRF